MSLKGRVKTYAVKTAVAPIVKKELEDKSAGDIIRGVMIPVAKTGREGRRGVERQLMKQLNKEIKAKSQREHKSLEDIVKDYTDTDGFMELWGILGFTEGHLREKVAEILR